MSKKTIESDFRKKHNPVHPVTKKRTGIDTLPRRRDEDLLRIVRGVFGKDLVVSVSVVTHSYEDSEIHEYTTESLHVVKRRLSDSLGRVKASSQNRENKSLHYDSDTIWIEFINGRVVEFSASEWAWISRADTESSYEA